MEKNNQTKMDVFSKEVVTELNKHVKVIRAEMNKVESSFTKIAFNLHWIYQTETFVSLGYDNVYEFAKNEFNISRGTANNFINVVERFGMRINSEISDQIADEYKDYKSSQLIAMLGMEEKELEKINKNMSVRDIKKIKKESSSATIREGRHKDSTSGEEQETIDIKSETVNRTVMLTLKDWDDYLKHRDTIETMINRAFFTKDFNYKVEISCTWE